MTLQIKVNARLFRAAYNCVSTEETRYYLNGVNIERHPVEGVFLVATDGHRAVIIHDKTGTIEGSSAIVKLDKAALTACKAIRGEANDRTLVIEGANATVITCYETPCHTAYNVIIDGTFPDWRRIARPNLRTIGAGAYNPKYLNDFGRITEELSENKSASISIAGSGSDPALVRFSNVDYAYGILMPIRFSSDMAAIPLATDYCDEIKQEAAA